MLNIYHCVFLGSDNRLQLYAQICLQGKKKSPLKRITGFQVGASSINYLIHFNSFLLLLEFILCMEFLLCLTVFSN